MNRTRSWLCALLVGVVSTGASSTATAKSVRVSRIPTATIAKASAADAAPKQIAKGSRVDGLFVVHPPARWQNKRNPMAAIASSKDAARAFSKGEFNHQASNGPAPCFTAVAPATMRHAATEEFPSEQATLQQIWSESPRSGRVWLVRSERFVRGAKDDATLYVTDAYVDAVSLGAKLVSRSTVALKRIAEGPRNVEVYAARDGERVQFVVTPGDASMLPEDRRDFLGSLRLSSVDESGFSQCGFLRTTLGSQGGGRTTTVLTPIPLEVETLAPTDGSFSSIELVMREAAIHLSVSHTSADRLPVVSVGFGWEGESRRLQF